jgi:MoaA/NifB/PqqE/SkfB family radical SAM enzyme
MRAPAAQVAVVMLTPACDMACPYCGAEASFRALGEGEAAALMWSLAGAGFRSVVLGGGEPFCWQGDLRRLAASAKAAGLEVQVGSNLRRLPADAPAWDEVDRWVLPLESADAAAHDALRPGAPSHYGVVLGALEAFRRAGREVTVSSVARPGAAQDLAGVAQLLRSWRARGLRLHAWHLYRFQAMGRAGACNAARFAQDEGQWRALADGLRQAFPDLPLLLRPDLLHSRQVAFFWGVAEGLRRQGPGLWSGLLAPARGQATKSSAFVKMAP